MTYISVVLRTRNADGILPTPCSPLLSYFKSQSHMGKQVVFKVNGKHKSMLVILSDSMYSTLRKYDLAKIPLNLANTIPKLLLSQDFPSGIEG